MNPKVFLHTNQITRLLSSTFDMHKGVAFEWANEGVIHAHIEFPEIAPSGLPILAFFKLLTGEELSEPLENLITRYESLLKNHANEQIDQLLAIFFRQDDDRKFTIAGTALKRFNQVIFCQPVLIPVEIMTAVAEDKPELIPVLASKKVVLAGAGSFGAALALELAQAGIGKITLFDHDTLSPEELHRHPGGLNDIGRYKSRVARDLIRQKNPITRVVTHETDMLQDSDAFQQEASDADLLICLTNENKSADVLNKIAVQLNKPAFFARALPDASFGTVFCYRPGIQDRPCLNCLGNFALINDNGKINYIRLGDRIYPTLPAEATKGRTLYSDLSPYTHLLMRLALDFLTDTSWALAVGPKNPVSMPLYFWANQRIPLPNPQRQQSDDYAVQSWHPIDVLRFTGCPVCNTA